MFHGEIKRFRDSSFDIAENVRGEKEKKQTQTILRNFLKREQGKSILVCIQ